MSRLITLLILCLAVNAVNASETGDRIRHEKAAKMMQIIDSYRATIAETPPSRTLKVLYVTPSDLTPKGRCTERITRWFEDFADFTRAEFKRNGFGEHELAAERDSQGNISLRFVPGQQISDSYSYSTAGLVNSDIKKAYPELKFESEVLMIVCAFSKDLPDSTIRIFSPYYAYGPYSPIRGRAYLMDHEQLDIPNLADTVTKLKVFEHGPRNMTNAQFNVTYIGGAFHELGHALTLPHNTFMDDEAAIGHPLMGSGNYFYRADRRGDKKRTYLSFTETARLISHPLFSGCAKGAELTPKSKFLDYACTIDSKNVHLAGKIESDIPPYAVVIYADPGKELGAVNADYDSLNWTIIPDSDGSFKFDFPTGNLSRDLWQLRVIVCYANGAFEPIVRQNFERTQEIKTPNRLPKP